MKKQRSNMGATVCRRDSRIVPKADCALRKPHRTFTLVELLVVLAIIAAMATVIIPRMAQSVGRQTLSESAARFAQTCRTAREVAVASGRTCAVELDLDAGAYSVTQQDPAGKSSSIESSRAVWLRPGRWPETVKIASCRRPDGSDVDGGKMSIQFFADGRSTGMAIRLATADMAYDITVHQQTGRVVYARSSEAPPAPDQYDLGDG